MTREDYIAFLEWVEENCDRHPDGWTTTSDYRTVLSADEVVEIYLNEKGQECCPECGTLLP